MTRNNYEAIPSSYPEDEDETRSPDSDNSNALRPKIDFKKRTASIIVLVASVACIAFLATFKGSSQSTFQRNNLPEGKSSFSQIIAGISPTIQPSNKPTSGPYTVWPGINRPGQPTPSPVEGATIRPTHPTRIPTPKPTRTFIPTHPTRIPTPKPSRTFIPTHPTRIPTPKPSRTFIPTHPTRIPTPAPTDVSIRPGGGVRSFPPVSIRPGGGVRTEPPVPPPVSIRPGGGVRSYRPVPVVYLGESISNVPVEEVHSKVPVLYTKGSHKSKLAGSTGAPVEEHQAVRKHKSHKSKLATTTETPVEEHLTSAKTHKKKLSAKEKALLHEI